MSNASILRYVLGVLILSIISLKVMAQPAGSSGKIRVGAIIVEGDTIPMDYLPAVYMSDVLDPNRKQYLDRLRYNIFKVYPYVILASNVLKKMDQDLGSNPKRKERKKYLNNLDVELNAKFKDELKALTVTQGKILVKLINRQTGKNCYDIIKELQGGVNARMYQTAFKFINNDLKTQYDPFGEDKDIEMIVREIEAGNYFKHQSVNIKTATNN